MCFVKNSKQRSSTSDLPEILAVMHAMTEGKCNTTDTANLVQCVEHRMFKHWSSIVINSATNVKCS